MFRAFFFRVNLPGSRVLHPVLSVPLLLRSGRSSLHRQCLSRLCRLLRLHRAPHPRSQCPCPPLSRRSMLHRYCALLDEYTLYLSPYINTFTRKRLIFPYIQRERERETHILQPTPTAPSGATVASSASFASSAAVPASSKKGIAQLVLKACSCMQTSLLKSNRCVLENNCCRSQERSPKEARATRDGTHGIFAS